MQFNTQTNQDLNQLETSAIFLGIFSDTEQSPTFKLLNEASENYLSQILEQEFKAKLGQTLVLRNINGITAEKVILIGLGKKENYNSKALIKAYEALIKTCTDLSLDNVSNALLEIETTSNSLLDRARIAARNCISANYRYTTTLSQPEETHKAENISFIVESKHEEEVAKGLKEGSAMGLGMVLTRELGNLPGNICTPTYLGEQAKALANQYETIKVEVLEKTQIEALNMGSFLSVAAGSDEPPRFIVLKYQANEEPSNKAPIVLVGKGVTFDTGGISLKPGASMDEMKWDMCGAATVMGTFKFMAEVGLQRDVIGLIPATENMPSGKAVKPGDVITSMSGQTIEILNTDAEGRLILCDALTYAERFEPDYVIDMATLTGACVVALGSVYSGLFGNDQDLIDALSTAGKQAADGAWPMPLNQEYKDQLKSEFADMANIGGPKAGAITAAGFLSKFTEKYRWAHLDIAGTAWDKKGTSKGASGRPVPLLSYFLLAQQ